MPYSPTYDYVRRKKGGILPPTHGVDSSEFIDLWPYGGVNSNNLEIFARGPCCMTTSAGTVLQFTGYQASATDSTGNKDLFLRRSTDGGNTYGTPIVITPTFSGADATLLLNWGGTSWLVVILGVAQNPVTGTLYLFYWATRNGGQQPQTAPTANQQFLFRYLTSTNDGLTWGNQTDLTSQITGVNSPTGTRNNLTITAISNPTGSTVRVTGTSQTPTVAGANANISLDAATGLKICCAVKISGLVSDPIGLNGHTYWVAGSTSNTSGANGMVFDLGARIDTGLTPAYSAGSTVNSGSQAAAVMTWLGTISGRCTVLRSTGPHPNRVLINNYYRYHLDTSDTPFPCTLYADPDPTTNEWLNFSVGKPSDETNAALFGNGGGQSGALEPHSVEQSTDGHVFQSCDSKWNWHISGYSTDGGATFTTYNIDNGSGGTTNLQVCSCPAPVIGVGGKSFIMMLADKPTVTGGQSDRFRLTAFLSTDDCLTWQKKLPVYTPGCGYSDLSLVKGNVICCFEKSWTEEEGALQMGTVGNAIGSIGQVKFNLAAAQTGFVEQKIYNFSELASGRTAWMNASALIDYGQCAHDAVILGSNTGSTNNGPQYSVGGLGFGWTTGDGILLANQLDTAFKVDYLASDSGGFAIQWQGTVGTNPSSNVVLYSDNLAVGIGKANNAKGITAEFDTTTGKIAITVCDGSTSAVTSYAPGVYTSRTKLNVLLSYDNVGKTLTAYDLVGNTNQSQPTTSVGTLSDTGLTYSTRLFQRHDGSQNTSAGGGFVTSNLFVFTKSPLTPSSTLVKPMGWSPAKSLAETFTGPSTNAAGKQPVLWLFSKQSGTYGMRLGYGGARQPASPYPGFPSHWYVSNDSAEQYFSTTGAFGISVSSQATYAKDGQNGDSYWKLTGSAWQSLDSRTIGQFDFIANWTSAFTIFGKINIRNDNNTGACILGNYDGTHGWSLFADYSGNTQRIGLVTINNSHGSAVNCLPGLSNTQYAYSTWYAWALVFSGSGGAGTLGLTAYLVPIPAGRLLNSGDITGTTKGNMNDLYGNANTTAATGSSTRALAIGGGQSTSSPFSIDTWIADLQIIKGYAYTDTDFLNEANASLSI